MDELLRQSLVMQRAVTSTANSLQKTRENIRCLKEEYQRYKEWERNLIAQKEMRKLELDKAKRGEFNAEDKLAKIDLEHVECEKLIERQRKLLEDKSSEKYSLQNKLKQMHDRERRMHNEIEGLSKILTGVERRNDKHDVELLHLLDRMVVLEYTVQKMQVAVQQMSVNREDEVEDDSLKKKMKQLRANLEKLNQTVRRYEKEVGSQRTEIKLVRQEYEKSRELEESLTADREHEHFYIENAVRILGLKKKQKEEALKDFCVHKMKVMALEKSEKTTAEKLHDREDKLDFMESTRDEMKLLMKLTAEQNAYEVRLLREANSQINHELGQKQVQLEQRRKFYETLLARTPNKASQEMALSEFVQERENLKNQGDKLDKDVKKAEKELEALFNTLKILDLENSALKAKYEGKTKAKSKETAAHEETMLELKQKLTSLKKEVSYKRNQVAELNEERGVCTERLQKMDKQIEEQQEYLTEKTLVLSKAKTEQKTINEKLNRARAAVQRSVKGLDPGSSGYRDINLRHGRTRLQSIVGEVMDALKEHPQELGLMKDYLKEEKIAIPNN
ncbi:coiled-coil domain-containing protein 39-like [Symsagittifera roscoffensis]|uniref:coiled-coil domain-containing protein 39-like n=1 Tax=Symsagittifera roscoffensis TaxID=84072 RepID=UPI00307B9422